MEYLLQISFSKWLRVAGVSLVLRKDAKGLITESCMSNLDSDSIGNFFVGDKHIRCRDTLSTCQRQGSCFYLEKPTYVSTGLVVHLQLLHGYVE